ncbi:MAG: hypothetical protein ACTIC2_10805 [Enterococcus devriesei]|uniref:hypothetical protein n=1 Tax=Enterococcus devriesei TaxID=319970 RepID=UPI003F8F07DF
MEAVKNKKRDRTGEQYGEFEIIGPTENDSEWIARCSCGKERIVKNKNMSKLTHCNSCAAKLRMKKRTAKPKKPKKDKFTEMKNWMRPKKPKLENDVLYEIEDDRFYQPFIGELINEYGNSASFKIVKCHEADAKIALSWNNAINVKKEYVTKIE